MRLLTLINIFPTKARVCKADNPLKTNVLEDICR